MLDFIYDLNTVIVIINIVTFILYGIDKSKAKGKGMRIPELVLLVLPLFLFGGVGALLGMVVFNHKTSKPAFRALVPFSFVLNYVLCYDSFSILKSFLNWILGLIP